MIMKMENEVLKDFYLLADYLKKEGKIGDLNRYKEDFSAFLLHANHIKSYDFVAPFCKNKKVLDIGCFTGYGETRIFSQAKEIIAIDSDKTALEFARLNRHIPNVKFKEADAGQLPFPNESFDVIIAFQLIEHIPAAEVSNFLSGVKRVLKKKGVLFIATPNRKFRLMPFQKPFNPEHYQEFTLKGLQKILKNIFRNVQIKGIKANNFIEEIESKRVQKSFYRAYIRNPLSSSFNKTFYITIQRLLKKNKSHIISPSTNENTLKANKLAFNSLFQKFSMNDFYLESKMINKSMILFAICRK